MKTNTFFKFCRILSLGLVMNLISIFQSNAQSCNPEFDYYKSGLIAEFRNESIGEVPGMGWYNWDFGDGTGLQFAHEKVNYHAYQSPGVYNVCLTDSFCNGSNRTTCKQITISASKVINASFSYVNDSNGNYTFINTSTHSGKVAKQLWAIVDGYYFEAGDSVKYKFKNPGTYLVCIAVYDSLNNYDYYCETIQVEMSNYCFAMFEEAYYSGTDLAFTNQSFSTDANASYTWDFGDNTSSTDFSPRHVYASPGVYEVKLKLNGLCKDTFVTYVQTFDTTNCAVRFEASVNNQKVSFVVYDNSTNPLNLYSFDFGDGNSTWETFGNTINHIYKDTGTYKVCVLAQGGSCPIPLLYCQPVKITSLIPICKASFTTGNIDNTLYLYTSNSSSGSTGAATVSINWGDGNFYTGPDSIYFSHTYANAGIYFVSLTYSVGSQCADSLSLLVGVGPTQKLSGKVFAGNAPANYSGVIAYAYEPVSGTLNFYSYTQTNDSGYYEFDLVPGYYLVQANFAFDPFNNSTYMPTYYPSELNWDDALVVTLLGPRDDINIQLKTFEDIGNGFGSISGKVIYGNGNKNETGDISYGTPVNKMLIYLLNEKGDVLSYTHSHSDGTYQFKNLPEGNYKVWGEMAGKVTIAPQVNIATTNTDFGNVDIIVSKNFVSTGLRDQTESIQASLKVFPNPVEEKVMVQFANRTAEVESIQIYDISGVLVKTINAGEIEEDSSIDVSTLQSGIYFLRVFSTEGKLYNSKLQKL